MNRYQIKKIILQIFITSIVLLSLTELVIVALKSPLVKLISGKSCCLHNDLGMDHYFSIGGLPFLGLADNFFPKSNVFQTIFITFCNENNFFMTIF